MSGFYCGICGKNSDETEANFWEEHIVCTSCYGIVYESEEFKQEAKMRGLEPLKEYLDIKRGRI